MEREEKTKCLRLLARRRARLTGMPSNVSLTARTSVLAAICLQRYQSRVRWEKTSIIRDTYMRTTREHGRTTRMLKIGRHNGAHAEVREGRKSYKASKNLKSRMVKTRFIPSIHLYAFSYRHGRNAEQIRKWE